MTADSRKPLSRERAGIVDACVVEIAGLMTAGGWTPEAARAIAAREEVSELSLKQWAAQAGRLLRLGDSRNTAALRARNVARLDEAWLSAMPEDGSRNIQAGVSALAEQNKLLGLIVTKHEVTGPSAEEWQAYRTALVERLCDGCKEKLLAAMRERGDKT